MKKKKNKRGITSFEVVINMLIVIIGIAGLTDVSALVQKTNVVNQNVGYVARVASRQGGISNTKFQNYSGDFIKTNELYENVRSSMALAGVPESDWRLTINNVPVTKDTVYGAHDYGTTMDVKLTSSFKWEMVSNLVPGEIKTNSESSARGMSTFKVRNSGYK